MIFGGGVGSLTIRDVFAVVLLLRIGLRFV